VARNRVFTKIIGDSAETQKNPVSSITMRGWPETGFLPKLLVIAQKLKKTQFLRLRCAIDSPPIKKSCHNQMNSTTNKRYDAPRVVAVNRLIGIGGFHRIGFGGVGVGGIAVGDWQVYTV
jgi:hypothetical protein